MADEDVSMDSGSEEQEEVVESLVAGRQRRSTAANRYGTLLQQEGGGEDDDLELLFAEDGVEEDVEFKSDEEEAASDVQMDSSDDDDQGPAAGADDMEGEKEIEKVERAERKKKRKDAMNYTSKLKPRAPVRGIKVDPTAGPITPAARPKKKSERVSWLPTQDEGPVRSSSRRQTVQNKEVVFQRMKESETKRRQQIKVMEAAAKRKEATKVPALSQADRMAEAARVERQNAKTLNRWEAEEKRRQEERQAKLDALKNRKLEGPVITYWSGPCTWLGDKLMTVGTGAKVVEIKDNTKAKPASKPRSKSEGRKSPEAEKSEHKAQDTIMVDAGLDIHPPMVMEGLATSGTQKSEPSQEQEEAPTKQEMKTEEPVDPHSAGFETPQLVDQREVIRDTTSQLEQSKHTETSPSPKEAPPTQTPQPLQAVTQPILATTQSVSEIQPQQPPSSTPQASPSTISYPPQYDPRFASQPPFTGQTHPLPPFLMPHPAPESQALPPPAPVSELASRTLIILDNLDHPLANGPELRNHILLKARKAPKLTAKQLKLNQELCAITGHTARFRDPRTGLAYKGPKEYEAIRRLETGGCRWSSLLGTWVGPRERAAKGVPEGFTGAGRKKVEIAPEEIKGV